MLAIPSEVEGSRCLICKATSAGPSVRAGLAVPLGMTAIGSCLARGRQHFLEARITARRVPIWVEPQLAITETPDSSSMGSQLLKGLVVFASPTINFCQIKKWREARRGSSGQGQSSRARRPALSFLFLPKRCLNSSEQTPSRCIVGLIADQLLQDGASRGKGPSSQPRGG